MQHLLSRLVPHRITQTMEAKKVWQTYLETYLRSLDAKKAVIWVGDLNVAPEAIGMCHVHCEETAVHSLYGRSGESKTQLEQDARLHRNRNILVQNIA
jgi:exonuclease III